MAGVPRDETENDTGSAAPAEAAAPVVTRSGYAIFPGEPRPALASPRARAFAVRRDGDTGDHLFALVFESLLPRMRVLRTLLDAAPPGVLRVVDSAIVDWPPLGRRAVVAICETPEGGRLEPGEDRFGTQELIQRVVWPIARALRQLASLGVAHRSLRASNLFWADARRSSVLLGDCFSAPPGCDQPVAHETCANAAADPMGRAEGGAAEDLYALGVTVLELACKGGGWRDTNPRQVVQRKLDGGTAGALMVGEPPPPELMPLLRGLLNDDQEQRWGLDELEAWLRQERIPHHATGGPVGPGKALRIGQDQYRTRRSAAAAIAADPRAGIAAARSGAVAEWLRHGLRETATAQAVEATLRAAQRFGGGGRDGEPVLAGKLAAVVDPDGPIRYGEAAVMPEGFPTFLAAAMVEDRGRDGAMGIIRSGLLAYAGESGWGTAGSSRSDALQFATQHGLGAGIERTVYELNPDLPCLSPAIRGAYILDLGSFLRETEFVARTADFRHSPLDAHAAAFLAHRLALGRQRVANLMVRGPFPGERPMLELRLLAAAQISAGNPPLPLLANWMAARIAPFPARLHNRAARRRIAAQLAAGRESGLLMGLLGPLDNPQLWEEDGQGFERARQLFALAGAEMARLRAEAEVLGQRAAGRGREIAVAVSAFASFAVIVLALALRAP